MEKLSHRAAELVEAGPSSALVVAAIFPHELTLDETVHQRAKRCRI